ncbi:hypothetical protein HYW75_03470, partial [Candidatus Pacearchaeota archaeon]|nr:hypothetical protein [Candidatus Pacearchaeota archaeon]
VDFWTVDKNLANKVQEHFKIIGDEEFLGEREYVYSLLGIPEKEVILFLKEQEESFPFSKYCIRKSGGRREGAFIRIRAFWNGAQRTITESNELKEYLSNEENWLYGSDN